MRRAPGWLSIPLVLSAVFAPIPVVAGSAGCMEEIRRLPRHAHLRIHRTDGDPLEGRLLSVDAEGRLVWVESRDPTTDRFRRVALAESTLYRVDVESRSVIPAYPIAAGLVLGLGGFLLGYEYARIVDDDGAAGGATGVGLIVGGLGAAIGAVAGILFGPKRTETRHLDCVP